MLLNRFSKALASDFVTDQQNFKGTFIVRYTKNFSGHLFVQALQLAKKARVLNSFEQSNVLV